jgi:hypothetical protein
VDKLIPRRYANGSPIRWLDISRTVIRDLHAEVNSRHPQKRSTMSTGPLLHVEVASKTHVAQAVHLEELVLEGHVALGLQTDAGTEDVGQGSALLGKRVDDRSARRRERSLC